MATFNILGFNQEKLMKVQQEKQINLNGNDLIVLRNIVDMIDSKRLENKDINSKEYTWIKYSLLVQNLKFVSDKEDTFKKIITKLIKCDLLDREVLKSVGNGAYTYFRKTVLLESIEFIAGEERENKPNKKAKDSNGNIPIQGQIHVEEAIEAKEASEVERVTSVTGCTIEKAQEVLSYAYDNNKTNPTGFSIRAIKEGWELKKNNAPVVNNRSNEIDILEQMLLGQVEYNQDDIEGVLGVSREHNYISNNSKRFGA